MRLASSRIDLTVRCSKVSRRSVAVASGSVPGGSCAWNRASSVRIRSSGTASTPYPAAGGGTRFGGAVPKQYQMLGARTMLEHAVEAMLGDQRIERVLIVVAPSDGRWARMADALSLPAAELPTAGNVAQASPAQAARPRTAT